MDNWTQLLQSALTLHNRNDLWWIVRLTISILQSFVQNNAFSKFLLRSRCFWETFQVSVPISERFRCNKDQIVACIAKRCSSLRLQIISVCNLTEMTFRSYLSAITSCMFLQKGVSLQSKWLTAANIIVIFYIMMNMCLFKDTRHFVKGSLEIPSFELAAIDNLNISNQTIVWFFSPLQIGGMVQCCVSWRPFFKESPSVPRLTLWQP